jgi:tyrosinase
MTYKIEGIKKGLGPGEQVPLRREIDDWWFSKDVNDLNQRSLFVYALHAFMNMPPDPWNPKDLSYFSIAGTCFSSTCDCGFTANYIESGIHGQPLQPWDATDDKPGKGYCQHGSPLFPTWHRPYMLLYEQRLYEIMRGLIPETFDSSDQTAMFHAAETWRLPFWDWAMKKPDWDPTNPDSPKNNPKNVRPNDGPNVPFILTQTTVQVKTKTGVATVPNPMWRYILPENKQHPERQIFKGFDVKDQSDRKGPKPVSSPRVPRDDPTNSDV